MWTSGNCCLYHTTVSPTLATVLWLITMRCNVGQAAYLHCKGLQMSHSVASPRHLPGGNKCAGGAMTCAVLAAQQRRCVSLQQTVVKMTYTLTKVSLIQSCAFQTAATGYVTTTRQAAHQANSLRWVAEQPQCMESDTVSNCCDVNVIFIQHSTADEGCRYVSICVSLLRRVAAMHSLCFICHVL